MLKRNFLAMAVAGLATILSYTPRSLIGAAADSPNSAALAGQVTSKEEGPMEGVLVSAKKAGSPVTITVVSDQQGRYSFPRAKLEPGQYSLSVRAAGYDLENPGQVEVTPQQPARADLSLHQTKNL